ncbi:MAG: asparagine synthase (glutamine-hydrolyzing) [Armatimonadota bacterium]
MCGIAGVVGIGQNDKLEQIVHDIVNSQHKRGPDYNAVERWTSDGIDISFGHNRLAIIDLSEVSNQPMWDIQRQCCVVFNGEIYNYLEIRDELRSLGHSFKTNGDTEVILEAYKQWGIEAVNRFIGMFAFGLWDNQTRRLWLVRDRFGVKPLFYAADSKTVYFASSAGVIARHLHLKPNLEYLAAGIEFITYERDNDICQFEGLHALPPGHYLEVSFLDKPDASFHRYYSLEERVQAMREDLASCPVNDLVERVRESLESAIDLRLRSDVPVGISLSGGIDSSTVSAMAIRKNQALIAFSYGNADDAFSEGRQVKQVADFVGIDVVTAWPDAKTVIDETWETLEDQGAPFPNTSMVAQHMVFKEARKNGVIVLLGGQGGDEALMGYHKFKVFMLREALRRKDVSTVLGLAAGIIPTMIAEAVDLRAYWQRRGRFAGHEIGRSILSRRENAGEVTAGLRTLESGVKAQILDVTRFSLPTLLRYEDRNSMGNSIESRLPFMDHRFMELGIAIPDAVKIRYGYGKWVLREIAHGLIPEHIRSARRKRGFDVEQGQWLEEGLGDSIREKLKERASRVSEYIARPLDIDADYSNERLKNSRIAFGEAMTLIWLGNVG